MWAEAKQQPNSNLSRKADLDVGKQKQTAMRASSFITPTTAPLLNSLQRSYFKLKAIVNAKKAAFHLAKANKDLKLTPANKRYLCPINKNYV